MQQKFFGIRWPSRSSMQSTVSIRNAGLRWGELRDGLLVLIHTFLEVTPQERRVRIISARKATGKELNQYEEE